MPDVPELPPIAAEPLSLVLLSTSVSDVPGDGVDAWVQFLEARGKPYEVFLVQDALTDQSAAWTEKLAARHPSVRVLRDPERRGRGAGLRLALAAVQYPLVAAVDADYCFAPADLERLLKDIEKVHLVTGVRAARPTPLPLRIVGGVYRLLVRILFGLPLDPLPGWLGWRETLLRWRIRLQFGVRLSDACCPFRLYRREIFARIPIQAQGTFVDVEILAKANFLGCFMSEVPLRNYTAPHNAAFADAQRRWKTDWKQVFSHPEFEMAKMAPVPTLSAEPSIP
jgi:glycosyltransferase involved in cell wall biosynthesis